MFSVTPQDICTPGYTDKTRNVPSSVKRKLYQRYGITPKKGQYEVDHLIPLELGGSNAISNLWPQLYNATWGARQKDRLENELHDLVCSGEMDLASAQQAIANDWIATYKSIFHTDRQVFSSREAPPHSACSTCCASLRAFFGVRIIEVE